MNRNITTAARLREVLLNGHWIAGTNYKTLLHDVDWQMATRTTNQLNSIAALTFHVNYYLAGLLHAFKTGELTIKDAFSFDVPDIQNASDWEMLRDSFLQNAELFVQVVEQMDDALFDKPFVDEQYGTYQRNMEGVIEHSYYHLGQISLLKKIFLTQL